MDVRNVAVEDDLEEKEDAQSHSETSPSKQLSLLEPMVEEYIVWVDLNLDIPLNHEIAQHTSPEEEHPSVEPCFPSKYLMKE